MPCLIDLEVFDEPFVLDLTDLNVTANASQMIDQNVLMLLDEEVLPEELDEGLAEKLHSQCGVVLLEDEAQRMLLLGGVLRPLDDAREENDKHLLDAFLVKEIAGHLHDFSHVSGNLLDVVGYFPVLESLLVVTLFK